VPLVKDEPHIDHFAGILAEKTAHCAAECAVLEGLDPPGEFELSWGSRL
jgi:hypothetical protein